MASLTTKESKQDKYGVTWQLDSEVNECNECRNTFHAFRRKHHCRNCGMIFCNECSKNKMTVRGSANPKRVCDQCCLILKPNKKSVLTDTSLPPASLGSRSMGGKRSSTQAMQEQDPLKEIVLRWENELQDGTNITCHFQGTLVTTGTAIWYRSPRENDKKSRVEVDRQRLTSTRDSVYTVCETDVGHYLSCAIELAGNEDNGLETTSCDPVTKTLPGLQSVQIGLRTHQHTLRCDRSERVCDAVGKYREGETLFMTMITRGMADLNPSKIKCSYKWLKSTQPIELKDPRVVNKTSSSPQTSPRTSARTKTTPTLNSPRRKKGTATYKQAVVLFDFEAIETNEMSVVKNDILTEVEIVDADWARGSLRGMRGAVPTSYIQYNSTDLFDGDTTKETTYSTEQDPGVDSSDVETDSNAPLGTKKLSNSIVRRWRGSIVKMCSWEEISSGSCYCDKQAELKMSLDYVGHMIALEVTLEDLPSTANIQQVQKKALPVGPIEPANCRIDDLIITPLNSVTQVGEIVQARYTYYGGHEGVSTFSWIRITPQGSRDVITNMLPRNPNDKDGQGPASYVLTEQDMGCRLKVHVRVVRNDGLTVSFAAVFVCFLSVDGTRFDHTIVSHFFNCCIAVFF